MRLRRGMAIAGGVTVLAVLILAGAGALGGLRFQADFEREKAALLMQGRKTATTVITAEAVNRLPAPVQRYLQATGAVGSTSPRVALLMQKGQLRAAADQPWMPFTAEQVYSVDPPGFVWLAKAHVAPLVALWARDRFVGGQGRMLIKLGGLVTVADAQGPAIDQGAGLRYWGEIIAFPEVVTNRHLRWDVLDENRARQTATQGQLTMSADVSFDAQGLPTEFRATRYRDVKGTPVLTPWSGHCRDWQRLNGRLFPTRWESVWHLPEGDLSAVTMTVTGLATE